jgi:hypothetical protein
MLRTIIIGPDAKQAQQLEKAVGALANEVNVCRVLTSYPDENELVRNLRAHLRHSFSLVLRMVSRLRQSSHGRCKKRKRSVCGFPPRVRCQRRSARSCVGVRELVAEPFELVPRSSRCVT